MASSPESLLSVHGITLSGQRIGASYRLRCTLDEAQSVAQFLCHEHSLELPGDVLPDGFLKHQIVGRVEDIRLGSDGVPKAEISYAEELASGGLTTLLNLLMGNAAFLPGIELIDLTLPASFAATLHGPRFGVSGLRKLTGVAEGPLGATALKPLGASAAELARIAQALSEGGVDILKEDDGISTQVFAPFRERVERCAAAVRESNAKRGSHTLYFPNITGPLESLVERAHLAQQLGADGVEILPGMTSLDSLRMVRSSAGFNLPIMAHCAWQGALCRTPSAAMSMKLVFGTLPRLAGADLSITTSFGGRFNLSRADCAETAQAMIQPLHHIRPAMAMPGGGITLDNLHEIVEVFGRDCALLLSGALFRGADLTETCRRYMELVRSENLQGPKGSG